MSEHNRADVRDWGTPTAANINSAIQAMGNEGGGELTLPGGNLACSEPIDMNRGRVTLVGPGDGASMTGGSYNVGTRLYATHNGTLLKMRSPYGVGNIVQRGGGLRGVMLDGAGIAQRCLEVDSVSQIDLSVFCAGAVGTEAVLFKCGVTGVNLAETCCIQESKIKLAVRQIDTAAQQSAHCVVIDGSSNSNLSYNKRDAGNGIDIKAWHANGRGVWAKSGDNNDIGIRTWRMAGGTGAAFWAGAVKAGLPVGFEWNTVSGFCDAPVYAEGMNDAGVTAPITNIFEADYLNGMAKPTWGTGSLWVTRDLTGITERAGLVKVALADSRNAAITQRALMTYETVRLFNGSETHAIITDGTNEWLVRVDGGGNLAVIRKTGNGVLSLPPAGFVKIGALTLTVDGNGFVKAV